MILQILLSLPDAFNVFSLSSMKHLARTKKAETEHSMVHGSLVTSLSLGQMPNTHNLKEESYVLTHGFSVCSPSVVGFKVETAWWKGMAKESHPSPGRQKRKKRNGVKNIILPHRGKVRLKQDNRVISTQHSAQGNPHEQASLRTAWVWDRALHLGSG